jgi:hypothetical protein
LSCLDKVNQDYSRREFIKATALTVGAASALSVCGLAPAQAFVNAVKPDGAADWALQLQVKLLLPK